MSSNALRRSFIALVALAALAISLIGSQSALAINSISLNRAPAPPQAVLNDGAHQLSYNYSIIFDSTPDEYTVEVLNPSNVAVQFNSFPAGGASSPIAGNGTFTVPAGAQQGTWAVRVTYYSSVGFEVEARVTFFVTDAVGTLVASKYDDLNGNGSRDLGEPGVANWPITITGPSGVNATTRDFATGADGTVTIPSLLVGDYTVQEGTLAGWTPLGPTSVARTVTSGGTATAAFGNARLGEICGFTYRDNNENGVRDPQETTPVPGVRVTLSGAANGALTTGADGRYCFTSLPPGGYRLDAAGPASLIASGDADGPANGRGTIGPLTLLSGARIIDQDFGYKPPAATLRIDKTASRKSVKAGGTVIFRMKVSNPGASTARNVVVSDPLPANVVPASLGKGRLVRGEIVWRVGDLAPGASRLVTFTARADKVSSRKTVTNVAEAEADNAPVVRDSVKVLITPTRIIRLTVAVTG